MPRVRKTDPTNLACAQPDGLVAVRGLHAFERPHVVRGLLLGELQAVCRRDHDHALVRADDLAVNELAQRGGRNTCAGEQERRGAKNGGSVN